MSDDVNDAEAGKGGSAGESSPQETTVPLSALQAERGKRHSLETQLAELKGTVDTLKQNQSKPKEYTRVELQEAVDAGKLSRDRADQILEDQQASRLESKVSTNIETRLKEQDRVRRVQSEIDRYKQFKPEIMDESSEARSLVAAEYSRQVTELGKPENLQTELDALAATFGPASKLQPGKLKEAETHQEVGSDGGSNKPAGKEPKIPAHAKEHYSRLIGMGIYKGWDDPNLQKEIGDFGGRWQ